MQRKVDWWGKVVAYLCSRCLVLLLQLCVQCSTVTVVCVQWCGCSSVTVVCVQCSSVTVVCVQCSSVTVVCVQCSSVTVVCVQWCGCSSVTVVCVQWCVCSSVTVVCVQWCVCSSMVCACVYSLVAPCRGSQVMLSVKLEREDEEDLSPHVIAPFFPQVSAPLSTVPFCGSYNYVDVSSSTPVMPQCSCQSASSSWLGQRNTQLASSTLIVYECIIPYLF